MTLKNYEVSVLLHVDGYGMYYALHSKLSMIKARFSVEYNHLQGSISMLHARQCLLEVTFVTILYLLEEFKC